MLQRNKGEGDLLSRELRFLQETSQLTRPVSELECRDCCKILSDEANVGACQDLGCSNEAANCFAQAETTDFCQNGRDFLFSGASTVEGSELRCNGGETEAFEGFGKVPLSSDVEQEEENNCQSCCSAINSELDSEDAFESSQCFGGCSGQKNCFAEGSSKGRVACFIGADLISIDQSTFRLANDQLQDVQCVAGELVLEGKVNEERNDLSKVVIGVIIGGTLLLLIVGIVVFGVRRNKMDQRGSVDIVVQGLGGVVDPSNRGNRHANQLSRNRLSGIAPPRRSVRTPNLRGWLPRWSFGTASSLDSSRTGSVSTTNTFLRRNEEVEAMSPEIAIGRRKGQKRGRNF